MSDYVNCICPQFTETQVKVQRVPTVDTSNPFVSRDIPSPDESILVIRFANPRGINFPYLLSMLPDSFMSRPNTIVCPGSNAAGHAADLHANAVAIDGQEKARRLRIFST